jgi:tryprostatin B 6-hydroxylase
MGDLAFGKSFGMLESGKQHYALKLMFKGQSYLGYIGLLPWLPPILIRIPRAMVHYEKWVEWSEAQVEARKTVC